MPRPVYQITRDIERDWSKPSPYALPYIKAMRQITTIHDSYGYDSARGIVLYFLSNAASWRGPDARRIKQELKTLLR